MALVKGLVAAELYHLKGKQLMRFGVWAGEVERKEGFTKGGGKGPEELKGGETKQVSWK